MTKEENKVAELKNCPGCGSEKVIYREDDRLFCQACGQVFAELTPEDEAKFEKASDVI